MLDAAIVSLPDLLSQLEELEYRLRLTLTGHELDPSLLQQKEATQGDFGTEGDFENEEHAKVCTLPHIFS